MPHLVAALLACPNGGHSNTVGALTPRLFSALLIEQVLTDYVLVDVVVSDYRRNTMELCVSFR
jgi:hypothetical protein